MECAWPLSPILMLFGSAIVVVLIKTSNTKLKVIEVLMEEKNRSSGFFILFPPLSLLLFLVFLCFSPLPFLMFYFLSPLLPFFSTYSFSYVCFHHLFQFFILSTFWMSLLMFHFLFKFFFLHNHYPIFVFEFLRFLVQQNTALFSTFRPPSSVTGVTSQLSSII